jgi:hypothetical protein
MKRRVKLKITKVQQQTVSVPVLTVRARCPICGREVETLGKAQAAEVLEVNERTLDHLLTAGQVHAIQTVSGSLRICQDSLFAQ